MHQEHGLAETGDPVAGSLRHRVSPSEDAGVLPPAQGRASREPDLIPKKAMAGGRGRGCNGRERTLFEGERSCSREIWGRNFQKSEVTQHQKTGNMKKTYQCKECGETFNWSSNLITHERIHTGKKPYLCVNVGRTYTRAPTWPGTSRSAAARTPLHVRSAARPSAGVPACPHTYGSRRLHPCHGCGKAFSQSLDLVIHHRVHTGEKSYERHACGQTFSQSSHLVTHQRICTRERECPKCAKAFRQQACLTKHQTLHSGERPFACGGCGKAFSRCMAAHRPGHGVLAGLPLRHGPVQTAENREREEAL